MSNSMIEGVCVECGTTYPAGSWRRRPPLTRRERQEILSSWEPVDCGDQIETCGLDGCFAVGCVSCGWGDVMLQPEIDFDDDAE